MKTSRFKQGVGLGVLLAIAAAILTLAVASTPAYKEKIINPEVRCKTSRLINCDN